MRISKAPQALTLHHKPPKQFVQQTSNVNNNVEIHMYPPPPPVLTTTATLSNNTTKISQKEEHLIGQLKVTRARNLQLEDEIHQLKIELTCREMEDKHSGGKGHTKEQVKKIESLETLLDFKERELREMAMVIATLNKKSTPPPAPSARMTTKEEHDYYGRLTMEELFEDLMNLLHHQDTLENNRLLYQHILKIQEEKNVRSLFPILLEYMQPSKDAEVHVSALKMAAELSNCFIEFRQACLNSNTLMNNLLAIVLNNNTSDRVILQMIALLTTLAYGCYLDRETVETATVDLQCFQPLFEKKYS